MFASELQQEAEMHPPIVDKIDQPIEPITLTSEGLSILLGSVCSPATFPDAPAALTLETVSELSLPTNRPASRIRKKLTAPEKDRIARDREILARVKSEMEKPRLTASVRKALEAEGAMSTEARVACSVRA